MLYYVVPWIGFIYTVPLFRLVIEVSNSLDDSVDVSKNGKYYQHFYTGAFISEGYPAKRKDKYVAYVMVFGGLPSNTYTTMTLHSSPSLLASMSLDMYQLVGGQTGDKILGFSTELPHTPISLFTEEGYAVRAVGDWPFTEAEISDADTLYPAFLFSFKGQCSSHYNSS